MSENKTDEIRIAAVISDHSVFQRNKPICIFGTAPEGTLLKAKLMDKDGAIASENQARAGSENFRIYLPPVKAQDNMTLTVEEVCEKCSATVGTNGGFSKTFTDICIGEVWLAGGQSNMEFELQNCTEGPAELAEEKDPHVRFYYTNKIAWMDEAFFEAERNTCWQTWDSEWKKSWSAVGYFFAKKLAAKLGVTVGVIGCNWGGTSASCWLGKDRLEKDSELKSYLDEQEEATKGKSQEQQIKEYNDYVKRNDEWQKKSNELYAKQPDIEWATVNQILGQCEWPGPKSCNNPYRPNGLYQCMLQRIVPYSMKGFIFYQGESDDHKPHMYFKLFREMIDQWRCDWDEKDMPFIFVQLPGNRYKQDKDFKNWCLIREAQAKVFQTQKGTGMVCAADCGVYNDIHPKAKQKLAERMSDQALWMAYGLISEEAANGPIYSSSISLPGKMVLTFKNASQGFLLKVDKEALDNYRMLEKNHGTPLPDDFTGFEVAGPDGIYFPAQFKFGNDGADNTITLWNEKVAEPVFARYGWYNYGPATVYGKNGIPLSPFRTSVHDAASTDEHAEIQQIMTV